MARKVVKKNAAFTPEEKAAMKERARELKAAARSAGNKQEGEKAALAVIDAMPAHDRALGKRIHAIVRENAPNLGPRLWYGMPAYANDDGKVVCFFQAASKFKTRYATFAFAHAAMLDDGGLWPTGFGVKDLSPADEAKIAALVRKAVGSS